MAEEEIVHEIKACVERLNELSTIAAKMHIYFEFDDSLEMHDNVHGGTHRSVIISKRLA